MYNIFFEINSIVLSDIRYLKNIGYKLQLYYCVRRLPDIYKFQQKIAELKKVKKYCIKRSYEKVYSCKYFLSGVATSLKLNSNKYMRKRNIML